MKRMFLVVSLFALSAVAQNPPKPELYLIHEEIVKPSAVSAYEAVSKDFMSALAEKKVSSPAITFQAYMTSDFHYLYIVPLANFAALDSSMGEWEKAKAAVGADRWRELERRGGETMVSYTEFVTMRRPDLSYVPSNPRLKQDEMRYVKLFFYYLLPGKESESESVAKDYIALFKQKNISDPFSIYMSVFGEDLPLLVVAAPAKSAADFTAQDERNNATLGAAVRPLEQRAMGITRRFEQREAFFRPDLSYPAPMPPPAAAK